MKREYSRTTHVCGCVILIAFMLGQVLGAIGMLAYIAGVW